jgi:hypothetical protein
VRISKYFAAVAIAGGSVALAPSAAFATTGGNYGSSPVPSASVLPASTSPTVKGTTATKAAGTLPFTGADVAGIVIAAAGACGIGGVLVLTSRRRSRAAS